MTTTETAGSGSATLGTVGPELGPDDWPRRAPGLALLGEYRDSGYTEPQYLARRADGQMVQLSALLYAILDAVDGSRDAAGIAAEVGRATGRALGGGDVRYLIEHRLAPLGLVAQEGDAVAPLAKADPLLAVTAPRTLFPPHVVRRLAAAFAPLYRVPVVAAALLAMLAGDVWLFAAHGFGGAVRELIARPLLIYVAVGLMLASTVFHEIGHAAACRYGGGRPGRIGMGFYLIWPALYTDVTDAYRLGRPGRLRTDLGGVYFNGLFALGLGTLYAVTGAEVLLVAILLTHFEVLQQLLPLARLDGYYILGDVVGVPDLFPECGPSCCGCCPAGRRTRE